MDVDDKDKFEMEKRDGNPMDYSSSMLMSTDSQFRSANVVSSSLGQVPVCRGSASSGPSVSIARSSIPGSWDPLLSSQIVEFCDVSAPHIAGASSTMGMRKIGPPLRSGSDGKLEWHPSNSLLKGGIFMPNASGMISQSLSHTPMDSAFIEHATRVSCFNGGNFTDMVKPFQIPESLGPCSKGGSMMQGQFEVIAGGGLHLVSSGQAQKCGMNVSEASMDASLPINCMATNGSPLKNERRSEALVTFIDEAKQCASGDGNESHEAEFSGGQDEPSMLEGNGRELSAKSHGLKNCKRSMQENPDVQQKTGESLIPTANKTAGKQGKQVSQAPDPPKEEYIHVRARRGQATNSHSLAEKARREKISERMKFLQDLVPGCSKVTGKAVMLDEIINYVQSLQRQVEFLSMKLATVNPRLDFNLEELLAKDIIQSRAVLSSSLAFSPDMSMAYSPLHPSRPGHITAGFPGMESHTDVLLHRTMISQLTPMAGGFKENPQLPNAWDDELHNVVQMTYGKTAPADNQDINGPTPTGHTKV